MCVCKCISVCLFKVVRGGGLVKDELVLQCVVLHCFVLFVDVVIVVVPDSSAYHWVN